MPPNNGIYYRIVAALEKQPGYVFAFGTILLFTGGGTVSVISGLTTGSNTQLAAGTVVALACLALAFATLWLLARVPAAPSKRSGLLNELEHIRKSLDESLIKSDLLITLRFRRIQSAQHGRHIAFLTLSTTFKLENTSKDPKSFPVVAQIDPCRTIKEPIAGGLVAMDMSTNTEAAKHELAFDPKPDARGLSFLVRQDLSIKPETKLLVTWWTDLYPVELPYAEFWASADPIEGLRIEVDVAPGLPLLARADVYRRLAIAQQFVSSHKETRRVFDALGPFLPFQGVFVRVSKVEEAP